MIPKPQLLSIATETGLLPTTVEKDYALSWMLVGIARHPQLSRWVFKGGTCLKKCFFETYRFSEDLDFTVPTGAIYTLEEIQTALLEMTTAISEETGIQFPREGIELKESVNKRGKKTFVAKTTFVGPLNQPKSIQQRVKFDLTQDEALVDGSSQRSIFHPYSDAPNPVPAVSCYTIHEILAEKTRALFERQGTPRDIYDVINISRNFREDVDPERARRALKEKFRFKALAEPNVEMVLERIDPETIRSNWQKSLGHQLQVLPPADSFISELKDALQWWIAEAPPVTTIPFISTAAGEAPIPRQHFPTPYSVISAQRLGVGPSPGNFGFHRPVLDLMRFAARNRLRVAVSYGGVRRIVEPYSLRRPRSGNTLLYVFEVRRGSGPGEGIKALKVDKLSGVEVLTETFHPRYVVEL